MEFLEVLKTVTDDPGFVLMGLLIVVGIKKGWIKIKIDIRVPGDKES